jgi:hypothetical protein
MSNPPTLSDMVRTNDLKIRSYLEGGNRVQFWHAQCPAKLEELQGLGFDNYPVAHIPVVDAIRPYLFFFERILGAEVESPGGHEGDFFHSWCKPLIRDVSEISRLTVDPTASPVWQTYESAIRDYMSKTPANQRLPIAFPGLSPLDMACNLCGAESFFLMLYEEPEAAERLLDVIVTVQIEAHRRIRELGVRVVAPYGFPGVYCCDLQLPLLSPEHVGRLILPCYKRLGEACGGLLLAFLCADPYILRTVLRWECLIGCSFDKRLPFSAIKKHLGRKLFVISSYCYDDALDKPTLRGGIWWNPIVQTYSRELQEVYREFVETANLLISIERPFLAEVLEQRRVLEEGQRRSSRFVPQAAKLRKTR